MKMKNTRKSLLLLAALLALTLLLAGCNETPAPTDPTEIPTAAPTEPLEMEQRSLLLASGEQAQLSVTGGDGIRYESSDPEVASVDANGNVKALKKGNAMITVSSGEQTLYCGVIVDGAGEMIDASEMEANVVFSNVQLYHPMDLIGFGVDAQENAFYFSQQYAETNYRYLKSDSMLTKVELVDGTWQRSDFVHLYNHGYGYIGVERDGDDVYLLTESNGAFKNEGTTVSRVIWEDGVMYDEEFGQTWTLPELSGNLRAQSDVANDVIVVYYSDGRDTGYAIYDREDLISGEEEPAYLQKFACVNGLTPVNGEDDSDGRYNATVRGFAVHDGYIYQVSGVANMYLSVYDFAGNLQYCHRIDDYPDLAGRAPGSVAVDADGNLYIAVISSENGSVSLANVWKLEEVKDDENSK